jgi:hypothetical protein
LVVVVNQQAKDYGKYVATVEAILEANLRVGLPDSITHGLWRQLVVTLNAFASRWRME